MEDPHRIASRLHNDERDALLALAGEDDRDTLLLDTAMRLREHRLVTVRPDGHMDLNRLGHEVLDVLLRGA